MDSKIRLSYHSRLFIMLLGFSWALVACFVLFQYHREKQYKADKLDAQLQLFNTHLLDALEADTAPAAATVGAQHLPVPGLRMSVIARSGALLYDNSLDTLPGENHLGRPEIRRALIHGNGYATLYAHQKQLPLVKVGDTVEFGGLLGSAPVQKVHPFSAKAFVERGGRIPAPMQSLKN